MNDDFNEVSREAFFDEMGPKDVHPTPTGNWPYTSLWKTRAGHVVGKTVNYLEPGNPFPKTRSPKPVTC